MLNDIEPPNLDNLTSLIRIIRERQQLYFSILSFISKNIDSSSNKLDQIGLFNRFLNQVKEEQKIIKLQENRLYQMFWINKHEPHDNFHIRKNVKQIARLTSRLIQMLETSMEKSSNSIFNISGKLSLEFFRFKKLLYRITTADIINIKTYITTLLNYAINKFNRQIFKIQKYMVKLQSGQHISFRDMFSKGRSDVSCPEQESKQIKPQKQDLPQKQEDEKVKANKSKPTKSLKKGGSNKLSLLKKKQTGSKKQISKQQRQQSKEETKKSKTASKLLKFYHLLQLNKKQFMEDFIFEQEQRQKKQSQLLTSLLERNKTIHQQIKTYNEKSQHYSKTISEFPLNKTQIVMDKNNSQDEQNSDPKNSLFKNQSLNNSFKISMRKSFVISKRKSTLNIQNPSSGNSDHESSVCTFFSKTNTNLSSNGRKSLSKSHNKTNRMYIVKAPMVFEQQIIPQAPIHNSGRKDIYSLIKTKQKKNQNVRMRKRNNPIPLQKTSFLQTFRYEQQAK